MSTIASNSTPVEQLQQPLCLRGHWLTLARAGWWFFALYVFVCFGLGLSTSLNLLRQPCDPGTCPSSSHWLALTSQQIVQFQQVGISLDMPGMNGIEATRQIVLVSPHIAVLVISMFEDDDSVFTALQAGARGYLLKGAPKAEVLRSIRAVASGEAIFGAAIARRVIGYFATARPSTPANLFPELTEREREILHLLAQHKSNGEIATQLVLTDKTVRNYVSNICTKLQVVDRAEAILRARNAGLGAK